MSEYLEKVGNFSPSEGVTSKIMDEVEVFSAESVQLTTIDNEEGEDEVPSYMAPKVVEVRRYTLKK